MQGGSIHCVGCLKRNLLAAVKVCLVSSRYVVYIDINLFYQKG